MAWNPSPQVAVARDAAQRLGADRAVIVYTTPAGRIGYASFGTTKLLCGEAKKLADKLYDTAMDFYDE